MTTLSSFAAGPLTGGLLLLVAWRFISYGLLPHGIATCLLSGICKLKLCVLPASCITEHAGRWHCRLLQIGLRHSLIFLLNVSANRNLFFTCIVLLRRWLGILFESMVCNEYIRFVVGCICTMRICYLHCVLAWGGMRSSFAYGHAWLVFLLLICVGDLSSCGVAPKQWPKPTMYEGLTVMCIISSRHGLVMRNRIFWYFLCNNLSIRFDRVALSIFGVICVLMLLLGFLCIGLDYIILNIIRCVCLKSEGVVYRLVDTYFNPDFSIFLSCILLLGLPSAQLFFALQVSWHRL